MTFRVSSTSPHSPSREGESQKPDRKASLEEFPVGDFKRVSRCNSAVSQTPG